MRALTVHQPFAELIARGEKRVENRQWSTDYRGSLAIHAGHSTERLWQSRAYDVDRPPLGAVVCVVQLVDCVHVDDLVLVTEARPRLRWLLEHEHAEGPVLWVFGAVERFKPVPVRGQRGLWYPEPPLLSAIARAREAATKTGRRRSADPRCDCREGGTVPPGRRGLSLSQASVIDQGDRDVA